MDSPLYRIKGTIHGTLLCTHFGLSLLSCVRFFGTRIDGMRHNYSKTMVYLGQFGKQINEAQLFDIMLLAEHYPVKLLKQGTSCTNMDDLHYWQNHHSKNKTIQHVPPNIAGNKTTHYAFDLRDLCPQLPVLTLVSLDLNEMMLMVCFCQQDIIFSCCPSISHKAAGTKCATVRCSRR